LIEQACALPDRQSDPRPMLDGLRKQLTRLGETVTGVTQAIDLRFVFGPLLDLVVIALVGDYSRNGTSRHFPALQNFGASGQPDAL
jgi:hypothetical protein